MKYVSQDDTERIRKLAREGKIEFAADDRIQYLQQYVNKILETIGFPEAFVTDESTISDFIDFDCWEEQEGIYNLNKNGKTWLEEISKKLSIEVHDNDYIWELAKKLSST